MKNTLKLFGIVAVAAIIGFSMTGCQTDTPEPTVTGVTVHGHSSVTVEKGGTHTFTATVAGSNSPPQTVTWAIVQTNTHAQTTINANTGVLSVALAETLTTLTVLATSTFNTAISGAATVNIPQPTVTGVEIDGPSSIALTRGGTHTFTATVAGANDPPQTVTWQITQENRHPWTTINADTGVLSVAIAETLTSLTVQATSMLDPARNGTATVTVLPLEDQDSNVIVPGATLTAQLYWLRANAYSSGSYLVEINYNETIIPTTASTGINQALPTGRNNLTIILRGVGETRSVSLSANGSHFWIPSGVTLILDENITLLGITNNNHLVRVNHGGTLRINTGARITGNQNATTTAADGGGGIRVNNGGVFILDGGKVSGNSTTWYGTAGDGGGVRVESGGRFDMLSGTISGNAGQMGGGVRVQSGGTFRMGSGVVYGNESIVSTVLRNTSRTAGSASLSNAGTAQGGTFYDNGDFTLLGNLVTTNNTISITPLTGTVSITGTATVGRTLTANTADLDGSGTISFQWVKRSGGEDDWSYISGATGNTFVVRASDLNQQIAVRVTRADNLGTITSLPTAAIAVPREEDFTIDFGIGMDQIAGPTVSLTVGPETVTVSNPELFSQIWWYRGTTRLSGSGSLNETLTLDSSVHNNRVGIHRITVEVIRGGVLHSMVIEFTVVP